MQIKNQVIVITGSSSGIGEATAYLFASEGARIVVNSESNIEGGMRVMEKIKDMKGEAIYVQADVSDPIQAKLLIDKTVETFGEINILINNAGGYESQDFLTASKESWLRVFDKNLFSTILCSQYAAQVMLKNGGGKILNTASVYGWENTGDPTGMAYSVAKAGVISLTKNLAKFWSPTILVNAVAPGYVHIPRFDTYPEETQAQMKAEMLLGRFIEPSEVAEAFLYLAKNDAVTGEVHRVDGGFGLK
ncbi:MAG: SDR family oxidoreductase [Patescibacteria group bacterium]